MKRTEHQEGMKSQVNTLFVIYYQKVKVLNSKKKYYISENAYFFVFAYILTFLTFFLDLFFCFYCLVDVAVYIYFKNKFKEKYTRAEFFR
jgi:hypothetical protein